MPAAKARNIKSFPPSPMALPLAAEAFAAGIHALI